MGDADDSQSKSPPGSAAAAAAVNDDDDDDARLARRLHVLEQLTSVYGFTPVVAQTAVEACGASNDVNAVSACYNYILDANLASDQGGPIVPTSTCPHVRLSGLVAALSRDQLPADPHTTSCHYQYQYQSLTTSTINNSSPRTTPGAKADVANDGTCPGTENWLCLTCGALRCSRYVNGHGLQHWQESCSAQAAQTVAAANMQTSASHGHCLAVSLSDLSVWCHVCKAYIVAHDHAPLSRVLQTLERLKFPPATALSLADQQQQQEEVVVASSPLPPDDERDSKRHKATDENMQEDTEEEDPGGESYKV
jgi:hypothetical protein